MNLRHTTMFGDAVLSLAILFNLIRLVFVDTTVLFNHEYDSVVFSVNCAYEEGDFQHYRERRVFVEALRHQAKGVFGHPIYNRVVILLNLTGVYSKEVWEMIVKEGMANIFEESRDLSNYFAIKL